MPLVNPGFESTRRGDGGHLDGWTAIQHAGDASHDIALDSWQKQGVRLSAWVRTDGIPESGRGGAGLVLTAMRGATIATTALHGSTTSSSRSSSAESTETARYHGAVPPENTKMTAPHDPGRRRLLAAASVAPLATLVAACAGIPGAADGPPAPAPALKPGDRWVYSARDGFRDPLIWEETREILSASPAGIEIRVSQKGPRVDSTRVERWTSPGDLALGAILDNEMRRFAPPLPRWRYPLTPGDRWSLFAANVHEPSGFTGTINYFARVGGWRSIATPAGTFDAIGVRVFLRLDDEEFWRTETECNHLFWFAPAVGNTVHEEKEAQYFDKGDPLSRATFRTQHAVVELTSFRRA